MARHRKNIEIPENLRGVLARNLATVMENVPALGSQSKIAEKAKIGQTTVGRIARTEVSATIDNIEALARAIHVQPWQLLVPGLNPVAPPTLGNALPTDEMNALLTLRSAIPEWRRYVLALAMSADKQKQRLFLDMLSGHMPDEKVAAAYGKPDRRK